MVVCLFMKFKELQKKQLEVQKFNNIYEEYNKNDLIGLDIATLINKSIDNNEKYEITKDEDGVYIPDDEYSVKLYIKMICWLKLSHDQSSHF